MECWLGHVRSLSIWLRWVHERSDSWFDDLRKVLVEFPSAGLGEVSLLCTVQHPVCLFESHVLISVPE